MVGERIEPLEEANNQKEAGLVFRGWVWNGVSQENQQLRADNERRRRFLDSLQQVQIRIHSNNGEENNTNKTILVKPEHGKFRGDIWTYSMNKKEDGAVVGPFPLGTSDALELEVSVSNWHETLRETV